MSIEELRAQTRLTNLKSYTEATHTAYADVEGADPVEVGSRRVDPGLITVHYYWRTQLGDRGWTIGNIQVSGRWLGGETQGSGYVILGMYNAPDWARSFAEANMPRTALVNEDRP